MFKKLDFPLVGLVIVGVILLATYSISVVGAQQQAPTKEQLEEMLEFFKQQGDEKSAEIMEKVVEGKAEVERIGIFTPCQSCMYIDQENGISISLSLAGVDIGHGCYNNLKYLHDIDQVLFQLPQKSWPISMEDVMKCNDNLISLSTSPHALEKWEEHDYLFIPTFRAGPSSAEVDVKPIFFCYPDGSQNDWPIKTFPLPDQPNPDWPHFTYPVIQWITWDDIHNKTCVMDYTLLPEAPGEIMGYVWFEKIELYRIIVKSGS